MVFKNTNREIFPRAARHNDDTKGVEDISPGLLESARATPGFGSIHSITFARRAASEASISGPLDQSRVVNRNLFICLLMPGVRVA